MTSHFDYPSPSKKYERLSCHTARRTFVTLSLEARIRPEVVMRVSGHRMWQAFRRYVAISEQVVEQEFGAVYGNGENP